ncbi:MULTISPECIES: hypothetical protein [Pseudoalteromonas]|uniref:hypothetical protein n=1 Tax=Pseudoalteromonas TaxID=53246 RepID=UPI0030C940C6
MIFTNSYSNSYDKNRRILEKFCAIDSSVSKDITDELISSSANELIIKLVNLVSVHGIDKARNFIKKLELASDEDACDIISTFLENGTEFDSGSNELQQEILHFSRIVDIEGVTNLLGKETPTCNKRLARSKYIDSNLKVLIELLTVVSERIVSSGNDFIDFPLQHLSTIKSVNDSTETYSYPEFRTPYVLAVSYSSSRRRRELGFLYRNILNFIGPRLALQVLTLSHLIDVGHLDNFYAEVITHRDEEWITIKVEPSSGEDVYRITESMLPAVVCINESKFFSNYQILDNGELKVSLPFGEVDIAPPHFGELEDRVLEDTAITAIEVGIKEEVVSMESGHLHLDRLPSRDQKIGIRLGKVVADCIKKMHGKVVALTPMYDDDHVLVKTTPEQYNNLFKDELGIEEVTLIPESSPIVKSIAIALYQKIVSDKFNQNVYQGGGNLYLRIDDKFTVEIFEDFQNEHTTGCVFFETSLLIYRSCPELFNELFLSKYPEHPSIHSSADAIWSESNLSHDERAIKLKGFYGNFEDVCNPHKPDSEFVNSLIQIIEKIDCHHLNVLEDYYEVQQEKVRRLLEVLNVNIRLSSLHFNRFTGRVVLNQ